MTETIPKSVKIQHSPFDNLEKKDSYFQVANNVYYSLIENGPIGNLFRMDSTRFGPSKGGSNPEFKDYYDQTHFQHALNVATAAGILFCAGMNQNGEKPTEDEIQTIMWAGALHDFNKIVNGRFPDCLKENETRFIELAGNLPSDLYDSIRHLILATEDGTDGAATEYHCILKGNVLKLAIVSLAAGDTLSTTRENLQPDDVEAYQKTLENLRRKHGNKMLPDVHVLPIYDVPQTALVATIRSALLDWIRENGLLLHDSPRRVSWIGPHWNDETANMVAEKTAEKLKPSDFRKVVKSWGRPAGNAPKIRTDWVDDYTPSRDRLLEIIDVQAGSLILWDKNWLASNEHFSKLTQSCPAIKHVERSGQDSATIELPEDDGTESGRKLRTQAQTIIASCILHTLTGETSTSHPKLEEWHLENVKGTAKKYVAGILDVIEGRPSKDILDSVLDKCVIELNKLRKPGVVNQLFKVVNRVLGQDVILDEPGSTGNACVICGSASSIWIDKDKSEGISSDGWLPRSAAIQKQTSKAAKDAKICELCMLDSNCRAQIIQNGLIKGTKSTQYIHIHKSDTAVEGSFANLIGELSPNRITQGGYGITLYARGKEGEPFIPHDNHISTPVPACGNTEEQVRLLKNIIQFCYDTGHKVQITSLGGIPRLHACMLHWQNAPSWVHNLRPIDDQQVWSNGMAAIRCDQIPLALIIINAIMKAAFVNSAGKSVSYPPLLNTLVSNPLGLYRFPCNSSKDQEEPPTTILERYFMTNETVKLLEKAGHAYCKFNTKEAAAWGKSNHWQWATRSTIRNLEKQNELASASARGLLLNEAQRKFGGAKDEDIDEFVSAIDELLNKHGEGNDQVARDIIAAVEWTAERLYRQHYSKKAREGGKA